MNIRRRIEQLETGKRRGERRRPSFREWFAGKVGVSPSELDHRINSFRDLVLLRGRK